MFEVDEPQWDHDVSVHMVQGFIRWSNRCSSLITY